MSDLICVCPTHAKRQHTCNHIQIQERHHLVQSINMPSDHTIIIEADIQISTSKLSKIKIDGVFRHGSM